MQALSLGTFGARKIASVVVAMSMCYFQPLVQTTVQEQAYPQDADAGVGAGVQAEQLLSLLLQTLAECSLHPSSEVALSTFEGWEHLAAIVEGCDKLVIQVLQAGGAQQQQQQQQQQPPPEQQVRQVLHQALCSLMPCVDAAVDVMVQCGQ